MSPSAEDRAARTTTSGLGQVPPAIDPAPPTPALDAAPAAPALGALPREDVEVLLPPPTPVTAGSTAGVVVRAHLRRQTAALLEADSGVPDDRDDAVHAARVAARRLRSGLRIYGDLLDDDSSARLRPELSAYAGALAPARDLEVFIAALEADTEDASGYGEVLLPWLRSRRVSAVATAAETLRSPRADALRLALVELARAPRFTAAAGRRAARVLAPRLRHADHRAERLLDPLRPGDDAAAWHSARIAAKRARYAAEVCAPALGAECRELAVLWSTLTEPLGAAQDAAIQRALVLDRVDDTTSPLSAGEAFACGVFVAQTRSRETEAHRTARHLWHESRARHRDLRRAVGG